MIKELSVVDGRRFLLEALCDEHFQTLKKIVVCYQNEKKLHLMCLRKNVRKRNKQDNVGKPHLEESDSGAHYKS